MLSSNEQIFSSLNITSVFTAYLCFMSEIFFFFFLFPIWKTRLTSFGFPLAHHSKTHNSQGWSGKLSEIKSLSKGLSCVWEEHSYWDPSTVSQYCYINRHWSVELVHDIEPRLSYLGWCVNWQLDVQMSSPSEGFHSVTVWLLNKSTYIYNIGIIFNFLIL